MVGSFLPSIKVRRWGGGEVILHTLARSIASAVLAGWLGVVPAWAEDGYPRQRQIEDLLKPSRNAPVPPGLSDVQIAANLRAHVSQYWSVTHDTQHHRVILRVTCLSDGTVVDAREIDKPANAGPAWEAAAAGARRAVRQASPLPIPRDKASQFQDFVLEFNPKQMIMGR